MSAGTGTGNPYALGAIAAICYPVFFFFRIYYPGPPINVVFFFLTSQLVVGYSWQATHLPAIAGAG
jgi:nicotinamide riboside transporter PnuC